MTSLRLRQRALIVVAVLLLLFTIVIVTRGTLPALASLPVHRLLHLLGVLLFLGNISVSALWLGVADGSGSMSNLRFATRMILVGDLALTAPGAGLALYNGAVLAAGWGGLWAVPWLARSLALFFAITALWATVLVPLQIWLDNAVCALPATTTALPPQVRKVLVLYFALGGLALVLAALIGVLMVLK